MFLYMGQSLLAGATILPFVFQDPTFCVGRGKRLFQDRACVVSKWDPWSEVDPNK